MVVLNAYLDEPLTSADPVVCHCLQINESTIRDVVARCPAMNLRQMGEQTGAGSGCTACHRRLRQLLRD